MVQTTSSAATVSSTTSPKTSNLSSLKAGDRTSQTSQFPQSTHSVATVSPDQPSLPKEASTPHPNSETQPVADPDSKYPSGASAALATGAAAQQNSGYTSPTADPLGALDSAIESAAQDPSTNTATVPGQNAASKDPSASLIASVAASKSFAKGSGPDGDNNRATTTGQAVAQPTVEVTFGAATYTANPSGLVLGSTTLIANGPAATLSGTVISLATNGVQIGSSTVPFASASSLATSLVLATAEAAFEVSSIEHTAYKDASHISDVIVVAASGSSITLAIGGAATTMAGQVVSAAGDGIEVGSSTVSFSSVSSGLVPTTAEAEFDLSTKQYTAYQDPSHSSVVVLAAPSGTLITLTVGRVATTIDGRIVSAASNGIVVGSSTVAFCTVSVSARASGSISDSPSGAIGATQASNNIEQPGTQTAVVSQASGTLTSTVQTAGGRPSQSPLSAASGWWLGVMLLYKIVFR